MGKKNENFCHHGLNSFKSHWECFQWLLVPMINKAAVTLGAMSGTCVQKYPEACTAISSQMKHSLPQGGGETQIQEGNETYKAEKRNKYDSGSTRNEIHKTSSQGYTSSAHSLGRSRAASSWAGSSRDTAFVSGHPCWRGFSGMQLLLSYSCS